MAKCKNCGSGNWFVKERIGTLETWCCKCCGLEETVHVFDPANEPLLPDNLEPVFRVFGKWVVRPSMQQVSEVQALCPLLSDVPVSALLRKAVNKTDIELGRFTKSEMRDLGLISQRFGMEITLIPINSE